jgi:hypothetical protein
MRQSVDRWRWGCQPYTLAALYTQEDSWYSFLLEAEFTPGAIVQLEGLGQLKNSITSLGIKPATFQLVTQCLDQLRYRVLQYQVHKEQIYKRLCTKFQFQSQLNVRECITLWLIIFYLTSLKISLHLDLTQINCLKLPLK